MWASFIRMPILSKHIKRETQSDPKGGTSYDKTKTYAY